MTNSRKNKVNVDQKSSRVDQQAVEGREQLSQQHRENEFRKAIEKGIKSADNGQLKPVSEVLNRLKKRVKSR